MYKSKSELGIGSEFIVTILQKISLNRREFFFCTNYIREGAEKMEESLLNANLFRHSFIVALVVGILCRGLVLRVTDKQYPSRPQDYLEQIIISGLSASLGAIALPALIDKEFAALTFLQ